MCDFKPGDEVVCVRSRFGVNEGRVFTVAAICLPGDVPAGFDRPVAPAISASIQLDEMPWHQGYRDGRWYWGYSASAFRKAQKRNDRLSIEAFLTIKPGFEEPRRAPAKKRERVS